MSPANLPTTTDRVGSVPNTSSGWARGDLAGSLAVPRLTTPPETDGWNQGAPFDSPHTTDDKETMNPHTPPCQCCHLAPILLTTCKELVEEIRRAHPTFDPRILTTSMRVIQIAEQP
jgi:hypothetical protein